MITYLPTELEQVSLNISANVWEIFGVTKLWKKHYRKLTKIWEKILLGRYFVGHPGARFFGYWGNFGGNFFEKTFL